MNGVLDGNLDPFSTHIEVLRKPRRVDRCRKRTEGRRDMVNIAVMGYGTVGSGVIEVLLQTNKERIDPESRG